MARGGDMGGTPRLVMSSAVGQGMTQPWSNWDKQRRGRGDWYTREVACRSCSERTGCVTSLTRFILCARSPCRWTPPAALSGWDGPRRRPPRHCQVLRGARCESTPGKHASAAPLEYWPPLYVPLQWEGSHSPARKTHNTAFSKIDLLMVLVMLVGFLK